MTVVVPVCPPAVAPIVAVPAATADTRPVLLTVATAWLLLDQVNAVGTTLPLASRAVAVSCTDPPTVSVAVVESIVTEETVGLGPAPAPPPSLPQATARIAAARRQRRDGTPRMWIGR